MSSRTYNSIIRLWLSFLAHIQEQQQLEINDKDDTRQHSLNFYLDIESAVRQSFLSNTEYYKKPMKNLTTGDDSEEISKQKEIVISTMLVDHGDSQELIFILTNQRWSETVVFTPWSNDSYQIRQLFRKHGLIINHFAIDQAGCMAESDDYDDDVKFGQDIPDTIGGKDNILQLWILEQILTTQSCYDVITEKMFGLTDVSQFTERIIDFQNNDDFNQFE